MKWHSEVLDASGKKAATRLAQAAKDQFYLAEGTALALRLGHRISLDLDLFSQENILGGAERAAMLEKLRASGPLEILENKDGTCHLRLGKTSVSLFRYHYNLLRPTTIWNGLPVASLEDIAAMKFSAIVGRGSKKDFVDLYYLSREIGLEAALKAAARKYRDHSDFALQAARALVYFDDAEKEPMPRELGASSSSWDEIKSFFETEIPKLVKRQIDKP